MPLAPDAAFWEAEAKRLGEIMRPWVEETARKGIEEGLAALGDVGTNLEVDWELINNYARAWAVAHTAEVVASITSTSMDAFTKAFPDWVASGKPLKVLKEELAKSYEPWRAQMIAVTETTRAYAQGNRTMWNASGVVDGTKWMTGHDEMVCPLCAPLSGKTANLGEAYEGGIQPPPRHVSCRCYEQPVVDLTKAPAETEAPKPKPTAETMPIPQYFKDWREAQKFASERFPEVKWRLNKMSPDICHDVIVEYDRLNALYPKVVSSSKLKGIECKKTLGKDTWMAQYHSGTRRISLGEKYYGGKKSDFVNIYMDSVDNMFHPAGAPPGSDGNVVFTHEFGHAVYYKIFGTGFEPTGAADVMKFYNEFAAAKTGNVGRYALTDIKEKFAESFAQMQHSSEGMWSPCTNLLAEFLNTKHMRNILGTP